ncbi:MAG: lipoprotein insertase outer membrane protein LolB [Gammaproteobacteria bacterium]
MTVNDVGPDSAARRGFPQRYGWVLFIIFLQACATVPVEKAGSYSRIARQGLYTLEPWSISGRLGLTGPGESWSASIVWNHHPDSDQIKLSGPLGQGAVAVHLTGDYVTIDRGGGQVETSSNPEQFVNQQLGLFVPIRSLRFWVIGLPRPGESFVDTAAGFKQGEWLVDYPQMLMVDGQPMPQKIVVTNEQVKLKLVIDQWILNEGQSL